MDWIDEAHKDLMNFYLDHYDYPNKTYLWERWIRT